MLQISTNNLKDRKKVEIDGHTYTARRLGAGEQLTINQLLRRLNKLNSKLTGNTATDKEEIEVEKLAQQMMDIFANLFNDGGDGSKSKALVASLNENEVQELFKQIFDEPETS